MDAIVFIFRLIVFVAVACFAVLVLAYVLAWVAVVAILIFAVLVCIGKFCR